MKTINIRVCTAGVGDEFVVASVKIDGNEVVTKSESGACTIKCAVDKSKCFKVPVEAGRELEALEIAFAEITHDVLAELRK